MTGNKSELAIKTYKRILSRRTQAVRGFNPEPLVKLVSGVTRTLIEAEGSAKLACDDLSNASFNSDAVAALGDNPAIAADYIEAAVPHIAKAAELFSKAKGALQQGGGQAYRSVKAEDPNVVIQEAADKIDAILYQLDALNGDVRDKKLGDAIRAIDAQVDAIRGVKVKVPDETTGTN